MKRCVVQMNVSHGGNPKEPIPVARGPLDRWLSPRALGENGTTEGLDYLCVGIGQIFRIGKEGVIRIAQVRRPCQTITVVGDRINKELFDAEVKPGNVAAATWGRSGFYAEVLKEGLVYLGDPIQTRDSWGSRDAASND
jgi:MOSC domain-containing protein YiiM